MYEEYAIHDYEYDGLLEALDYRPDEYENLDDLNLLARAAQVFERESPGMIERVRMAADTLVQSTPLSLANLIAQCDDIDWCEYDPPAGIDPANIDDLDELYAWHCVERDPDLARVMQGRWGMYMDMAWLGRDSALCDDVTLGEHGFLLANGVPDANRYDRGELRELLDALDPPAPAPDFRLEDLLDYELSPYLQDDKFCLTTVDTIFREEEFSTFIETFKQSETDGYMAVTDFIDDEKPLYISTDSALDITGFHDEATPECRYISGGIYCLTPAAVKTLHGCMEKGMSRMRNFQRQLVADGLKLKAYPFTKILDVDHAGDIVKAENFLAGKEE